VSSEERIQAIPGANSKPGPLKTEGSGTQILPGISVLASRPNRCWRELPVKSQQLITMKKTLRQGKNASVTKRKSSGVDEYIARCPKEVQGDLAKIRAAIRAAAPGATERTDYFQMPGYSYPGIDYYDGMFAWFSFKKPYIRLHVPPSVIQEHRKELAGYATTRAIVSFPKGKPVPTTLVKKLVRASLKAMKDKSINSIKT
jgi:uncharacterized protein YdhG (YjbR/CyaY superfamily)